MPLYDLHCDIKDCPRRAEWATVGESGDFYVCDEHHRRSATGWDRIHRDDDVNAGR